MDFRLIGASRLNLSEKESIDAAMDVYWNKLERALHQDLKLVIHVKKYKGTETKSRRGVKYSVNLRAEIPGTIFESNESGFMDLKFLCKKCIEHLVKTADKRFRKSTSYKKIRVNAKGRKRTKR